MMKPQPRRGSEANIRLPEIERPRLRDALSADAHLPVRVLCAPVGAGKTTLLRQYVAETPGARYLAARTPLSAGAVREALAGPGVSVIVLDDFDLVEPLVGARLLRAAVSGRLAPRRLVIAGRSRYLLHVHRLIARGLARILDAHDLAFDRDEVRRFAERLGLAIDDASLADVLNVTDGWTLALTWILRTTAADGAKVDGAFERWSRRHGGALLEYVEENAFNDVEIRRAFMAALGEPAQRTQRAWGRIEAAGGPVIQAEGELRPYRIIAALAGRRL
jgi:ATP/maltotriose-dependent transcriptional regulator MalT